MLKQKLKTIYDDIRDIDYTLELTTEKIQLQNQYIDDVKKNKDLEVNQTENYILLLHHQWWAYRQSVTSLLSDASPYSKTGYCYFA
mgnify:CR=1 FL=1